VVTNVVTDVELLNFPKFSKFKENLFIEVLKMPDSFLEGLLRYVHSYTIMSTLTVGKGYCSWRIFIHVI
jgi:hypothetical protein